MADVMRDTFARTMHEVGLVDPDLLVLVGDISHFALQPFAQACPGRFYNVGILEPTIVSMSAGLASLGLHTVTHTIAPFLIERSLEQIKLDFCYQGIGGTLITVGSAFDYATLGCSHHCYDDISLLRGLPNTEIVYPASPIEFTKLFADTYRNGQLTYFRLPKETHGVDFAEADIVLGKGLLVRPGGDVTLAACGPQLRTALAAADRLAARGIAAEVLYFPTLKPFDSELLAASVARTRRLVCIEEHVEFGGLGDVALRAARHVAGLKSDFLFIPDAFQRGYGTYEEHCRALGFTPENLAARAAALCTDIAGEAL